MSGELIPLSVLEQGILEVIGEGKFSAREIFAEIKKLKSESLPPFLTTVDVNRALSVLRSEGFLRSEEFFTLTEEARSHPLKLLEQKQVMETPQAPERALGRNDDQIVDITIAHQKPTKEYASRRKRRLKTVKADEGQTTEVKDTEERATKLLEDRIDEAIKLISQAEKEGLFLFREGENDIFLLLDRRIMVRSKSKAKEILEATQAMNKFGYVRLSASINSALNRLSRS